MKSTASSEDLPVLFYLVPFVLSGAYSLYLWISSGISALLPVGVYLTVTRDPILFVVGSLAVMLGMLFDVRSANAEGRGAKLASVSGTLQSIAAASLFLTLFSALYANGFLDVSGAVTDFIVGRYGLVFPALLVLLSYLATARFRLESLRDPKVLGILAMLLVPASIYELGKRETAAGLLVALFLLLLGLGFFLNPRKKTPAPKEE